MTARQEGQIHLTATALGVVIVLFGLLLFASNANELLKQAIITPGSSAERGIAANCRADELLEEDISQQECELLVSNVQIILVSSPDWFRPLQLFLSLSGSLAAMLSMLVGFGFVNRSHALQKTGVVCFAGLLLLDLVGLMAAANTGPMLRAQYLWPGLIWLFIHLCFLLANWQFVKDFNNAASN